METLLVSKDALRQVLNAIMGPGHHIRELQATRNLPGGLNPIDVLVEQFNAGGLGAPATPPKQPALEIDPRFAAAHYGHDLFPPKP